MIEGIPKVSVLIICYNQEKVISRAIDSLLAQRDYIYEICVSDDCSNDRTWEILQEYSTQYPGFFVLNRNASNIGIFENIEKTWTMPSGDLVYSLSGDDECPEGWFAEVLNYVMYNNINSQNERFVIYGDYQCMYPSGDSFVFSNKHILSRLDPVRLSLRGKIGNRSAVCSRSVIDSYKKVSRGKSYIAECAQDLQLQLFAKDVYYIPYIGNIYYTRIGVSINMDSSKLKEREELYNYAMKILIENGYSPKKKDLAYVRLQNLKASSYRKKSIGHYWKIIIMFVKSFDFTLTLRFFSFKRYYFALKMRLPHKRPLRIYL